MKINYNNTALRFLEDPRSVALHTPDGYSKPLTREQDLKMLNALIDQFAQPGFKNHFAKNIQLVTQPFYNAYRKAAVKLNAVVRKTELKESGTLIIPWPNHTQTIFYYLDKPASDQLVPDHVFFLMLNKTPSNGDSFAVDVFGYLSGEDKQIADYVWKGFVEDGRDLGWWIADLILFLTFLKYAEPETKLVKGKKRETHVGNKYINETNKKVEILDSTYFTTISRTEGFGVTGHFRFQPIGKGRTGEKLIWIADFKKHGYTKRAKIIRDE